jgi:transcriptional regulator with XRE-family HTH domain
MIIGERLRQIREEKKLSQGDIERKTRLLRCYISRVENGHTVPSVETLQKFAHALEVPMYQLFYDSKEPPEIPDLSKRESADAAMWGSSGRDARILAKFRRLFSRLKEDDLGLVLVMARQMHRRKIPSK